MTRFVCIHGHFYQPPRENPWIEEVEREESARPYHDWNERICRECYEPNAEARLLDDQGRVRRLFDNYAHMSFNFGPTLLAWMERRAPRVYEALLAADRSHRGEHGPAIAQAYSHAILPLASEQDRRIQVAWGLADFRHRFGREPEALWLPETAVDLPTLETLADFGLKYVILAPKQAARIRRAGTTEWEDVEEEGLDVTRPYLCRLPSGRELAVFFYHGRLSQELAFGGLLRDGRAFAQALLAETREAGLLSVAVDGETFGHHHRFGEMALAYALEWLQAQRDVELVTFGEYLAAHPPEDLVEIREPSSWSCAHGVERWRSDCGCASGAHPDWNQAWRSPLRQAMDELAGFLAETYQAVAGPMLSDPRAALEDYVQVVLEGTDAARQAFLDRHAARPLSAPERQTLFRLLESRRFGQLMLASCGWFFDDLAGLEAVQVMKLAARAMDLAELATGRSFESRYLDILEEAVPNDPAYTSGRQVYEKLVAPSRVDPGAVAAHYAVRLALEGSSRAPEALYGHEVAPGEVRLQRAGRLCLATGKVQVRHPATETAETVAFALLHLGDHTFYGGLGEPAPGGSGDEDLAEAFQRAAVADLLDLIRDRFPERRFDLWDLLRDEQEAVLAQVLGATLEDMEAALRTLYEANAPVMLLLHQRGHRLPEVFATAARFLARSDLLEAFETEDWELVADVCRRSDQWGLELRDQEVDHGAAAAAERLAEQLAALAGATAGSGARPAASPAAGWSEAARALLRLLASFQELRLEPDLWRVQNLVFHALEGAQDSELAHRLAERLQLAPDGLLNT